MKRIETFYSVYLGAKDTPYTRALGLYTWTALAGRAMDPGCQADMAPIWVSPQGSGKTSSLMAMAPRLSDYGEIDLSDRSADLARMVRGKSVIELSELRGLNSREIEHIKAFISRREERWIPKYMEFATVYKRHCIFFGTTNSDEFLADETGNRRFLPVRLGPKQDVLAITRDHDQLWAEGLWRWKREGVLWQDVARLVTQEHAQFMVHDPWEDTVGRWMRETPVGSSVRNGDRPFIQTDEIMRDALHLEARSVKGSDGHRLGRVMRALNCEHVQKRVGGTVLKGWRKK